MEQIIIRTYKDSLGRIIRFDFCSVEQIIYYKNLINQLVRNEINNICFNEIDVFKFLVDVEIFLEKGRDSFIENKKKKGKKIIKICQDKEGLITHSYLLDSFMVGGQGHQYIYIDQYIILLSLNEDELTWNETE